MLKSYCLILFVFFGITMVSGQGSFNSESLLSTRYNNKFIGGRNENKNSYTSSKMKYDYSVKNKQEFLAAIKSAGTYKTIFIEGNAVIDLSDQKTVYIKTGIKIISDRGYKGGLGAKLFSNNTNSYPLFECGSYVSFIGLRIMGNDESVYFKNKKTTTDFRTNTYGSKVTQGIRSSYSSLNVENCELSGWSHAAIVVKGKNAKITYSYIHHNRRHGLGYGIVVDGGSATIQGNLFDYNRHSIASTGIKGSSYYTTHNIFLENGTSHVVDVHGGQDRKDNTNIAGDSFEVTNNYFRLKSSSGGAFVLRGKPVKNANFSNNVIQIIDRPKTSQRSTQGVGKYIKQKYSKGNFSSKNNILK